MMDSNQTFSGPWKSPELQWLNEEIPSTMKKLFNQPTLFFVWFFDCPENRVSKFLSIFRSEKSRALKMFDQLSSHAQVDTAIEFMLQKIILTEEEWFFILWSHRYRCLCCGSEDDITMDHIIPLSKGGTHSMENIQPLCLSCNSRKGTKFTDYRSGRCK